MLEKFQHRWAQKAKSSEKPIVPGTRLSENNNGAGVDATMFKQAIGSTRYVKLPRPYSMYGLSFKDKFM